MLLEVEAHRLERPVCRQQEVLYRNHVAGDRLCIAVEMDDRRIWLCRNGASIGAANPETGKEPTYSGRMNPGLALQPGLWLFDTSVQLTIPGGSFLATPPAFIGKGAMD